ncbi:hypothetical protein [Mycolicibacterium hassiacum]|uniref:hypothetical protein n=1 Tax=Mycolicibacterium hassiacum TaxID=46351 RepID=UPI001E330A3E|nr:hypothetical protein [Mycolicibacterium hassiacum]
MTYPDRRSPKTPQRPVVASVYGEIRISQHHRPDDIHRGVMMPRRKRTRAQDKAYRVARERRRNTERLTAEELFLAERLARDDEPPPF